MRKILLVIVGIAIIGIAGIIYGVVRPGREVTPTPTPIIKPTPAPTPTPTPTPIITPVPTPAEETKPSDSIVKISAERLCSEFKADRVAFEAKYKDKILEVTGEVASEVYPGATGISLVGGEGSPPTRVGFHFPKEERKNLLLLPEGMRITIRGKLMPLPPPPARVYSLEFSDASIVNFDSLIEKVSAEKLYSEFEANAIRAESIYGKKILEITGIIERIGDPMVGDLLLKAGMYGIRVNVLEEEEKKLISFSRGQTITIRGKFDQWLLRQLWIENAQIIK